MRFDFTRLRRQLVAAARGALVMVDAVSALGVIQIMPLILIVIGRDPIGFYGNIVTAGLLRPSGLQDTITRMAPALLIGAPPRRARRR